jgi:hypothetical protein
MTKDNLVDKELTNLATVAEYLHGGPALSNARKIVRSSSVMFDHFDQHKEFAIGLGYYVTTVLQTAYGKISRELKSDLSNLDSPEFQAPLAADMPSNQAGKINNVADLITTILPADGKLNLTDAQKAEVYKFLVKDDALKTKRMDDAVKANDSKFINEKFDVVVEVLFIDKANYEKALEKMAKHPGMNCPGCEVQENMNAQDAKKPAELKSQLDSGQKLQVN